MRGSLVAILALVFTGRVAAQGRTIEGVTLGETHARDLLLLRGTPDQVGRNNGGVPYLAYGVPGATRYTYYLAPDSIIDWARVIPNHGQTPAQVHAVLGRPLGTRRNADLSLTEEYSDRFVNYTLDGTIGNIEYHATDRTDFAARQRIRTLALIDTLMAFQVQAENSIGTHNLELSSALDSVHIYRWFLPISSKPGSTPRARDNAARYNSLRSRVNADSILLANGVEQAP